MTAQPRTMLNTASAASSTASAPLLLDASERVKKIATRLTTLAPRIRPSLAARESSSAIARRSVPFASFSMIVAQTQPRKTSVTVSQPTRTETDQDAPARRAIARVTIPAPVPTRTRRRARP
jgi:hypothetical protein